jgi:RNA polymerase sigma-70 factor (ECF subfamily)
MLSNKSNLIKGIIQGDRGSFETVFNEFFPRLYRFCSDFIKDNEVAKDIVLESFIRLWESRQLLRADTNLEAYLITICRNKCLNFIKHKKVILRFQEEIDKPSVELDYLQNILEDNNYSDFDFDLLAAKIDASIQNLPDQCRAVFILSRFGLKKYSEIASLLAISVKTVESHMSLALKRLRDDLKDFM